MDSEAQGGVDWKRSRCLDAKFVVPGAKEEERKWSPLRKRAERREKREGMVPQRVGTVGSGSDGLMQSSKWQVRSAV